MTVEVVDVPLSVSVPSSINLTVNHPVPELAINLTGGASTTYSSNPPCCWVCTSTSNGTIKARRRVDVPDSIRAHCDEFRWHRRGRVHPGRSGGAGCTDPMATNSTHLLAKMTARASAWTRMGTGPSTRMR